MSDEKKEADPNDVPLGSGLAENARKRIRTRADDIDAAVEGAQTGAPDEGRKLPRGRTGVSRGQSPKGEEKNSD